MERSKRDLESLVTSQKEQLIRYETRLKDVVTAYKGLLKEKEALESSLAAVTSAKAKEESTVKETTKSNDEEQQTNKNTNSKSSSSDNNNTNTNENATQSQVMTLMNSLATLSAEKSRMEASFQADKKQLRTQLTQKDGQINELQEKLKATINQAALDMENYKAKLIIERQEHEQETSNQMLMIRELQKLYADERHLKENIEMQLNNLKTQFAANDNSNSRIKELQSQLKEAKAKLKQFETQKESNVAYDNTSFLQQLQSEMSQLKEQHAVAIKSEQKRAHIAEERNKKLAAIHEDRVANLESRLAELSATVGTYDRLRHQDQESIQALKRKLQNLIPPSGVLADRSYDARRHSKSSLSDMSSMVDEIIRLKKLLLAENANSSNPIDISKIFTVGSNHRQCEEDASKQQTLLDAARNDCSKLHEVIQVQKSHISTLQDKVKVLNRNIEEQEVELKQQEERLRQAVKEERDKWKNSLSDMENECRFKLNEMEQQLQKQRVRSLQLLDEKENEIKTLQTSFDVFAQPRIVPNESNNTEEYSSTNVGGEVTKTSAERKTSSSNAKTLGMGENCHMLHYANEIARKDIEIAGLRKTKYAAETALRKALQDKATSEDDLREEIAQLKQEVDRLERCKTREGANLEYLKNVFISFLSTKSIEGKRHMINAIGAVLQFTPSEIQDINSAFHKK
ncbi:GRIP and coiled-coil domain-containing protein 1 [Eupeodes corollae]|uniref:GRIP and coiled-coil domain-containing protein 1 n=1 Tax=Eupeodes corollae TaxID=290404 RepID=UPI002492E1FA|nr:GRIP and coiled-coil domain-containing protein 1 [Eupeodes corollae]